MHSPENILLAQILHRERLAEAERERTVHRLRQQRRQRAVPRTRRQRTGVARWVHDWLTA